MERGTFRKFIHVGAVIVVIFLMSGFVSVAGASCATNLSCIAHRTFVNTFICHGLYPDACDIHKNSLWDGAGANLYYGPGSRLANNVLNSNPQGSMTFKETINLGVKSEILKVYPDINCEPISDSQTINIFSNSNEFASGYFDLSNNPGLFFAFGGFHIFPDGLNQPVTLTRVGENNYEVTGTIKIYLNDYFHYTAQEWTDKWAYKCQQAGCIHNFWTRVDMNFAITDLEFQMNSQNMHCEGDPDEIKCCLDGCCSGECCAEGTPNAGICYDSSNPEDGCCQYKVNDEEKCYEGNHPPDKCTTCYGGSWHSGWWCEEGECVPEASTLVLFATGLLCMAGYLGLRRKEK